MVKAHLPLILSTSKYFRWKFQPCPLFHTHPNISDIFVGDEMNIFWFPLFFFCTSITKQRTHTPYIHISIYSTLNKLKGRVEPSWMLEIFDPSDWCIGICKTIFAFFKPKFQHEDGLVQHRYFELFFSAWSIFSSYKRSAPNETVFNFFVHLL